MDIGMTPRELFFSTFPSARYLLTGRWRRDEREGGSQKDVKKDDGFRLNMTQWRHGGLPSEGSQRVNHFQKLEFFFCRTRQTVQNHNKNIPTTRYPKS